MPELILPCFTQVWSGQFAEETEMQPGSTRMTFSLLPLTIGMLYGVETTERSIVLISVPS